MKSFKEFFKDISEQGKVELCNTFMHELFMLVRTVLIVAIPLLLK